MDWIPKHIVVAIAAAGLVACSQTDQTDSDPAGVWRLDGGTDV